MIDTLTKIVALKECGNHSWEEIARHIDLNSEAARGRYRRRGDHHYSIISCPICGVPRIDGRVAGDVESSPDDIWQRAIDAQRRFESYEQLKEDQRIVIPGRGAFGWATLSDLHLGGNTDYRQIRRDAEIIRNTDRLWAGFHGDGIDNWILAKLQQLQRKQSLKHDESWQLFYSWLDILGDKLLLVVPGNHELWAIALAGVDRVRERLINTRILYDEHEVIFDLIHDENSWRVKERHSWRGHSVFNITHGIEVTWQRGGDEFDIGIGGHTHIGTLCRPFIRHGKKRYAILTGTYSLDGDYGRQLGVAPSIDTGCGAIIFTPDGRMFFIESLELAAEFLKFLNRKD